MTLLGVKAQECSSIWVTCPEAFVGQQVAYSNTYTDLGELKSASVVVASTGYYRLYVNGNLVSVPSYPFARAPYREGMDKTKPLACKYDVSRYLRNDSVTVTVLSCPTDFYETPSFSLRFCGVPTKGRNKVREADYSWICSPLEAYETDIHSEYIDGKEQNVNDNSLFPNVLMRCLPVELEEDCLLSRTKYVGFPSYEYISKVIKPKYFSSDWDEKGISYDFGNGFYGLVRITLRDTKAGQHIYVAGSDYVCKGVNDEQFVLRFAASWFRKVYIFGDEMFRLRNVSRVEGLQIVPKTINNFSF